MKAVAKEVQGGLVLFMHVCEIVALFSMKYK